MSLFGALYSGVSGLQSQSSAMGAIADNVTNVNTIGYKNTNVNYKTLITAQTSTTQYSPGGVQSAPRQAVDLQGLLQATTSSTDVAISGTGFFVANQVAKPDNNGLFTYTRAGSFKVDREGFLQNAGGSYMQGWPLTVYDGSAGASTLDVGQNTFMRAYIKGVRVYNDALKDGRIAGPGADDVVAALVEYSDIKDAKLHRETTPAACDPDGAVNIASLQKDADFYLSRGWLEKPIKIADVVDESFVQEAARQLGPFR